MFLVPAKVIVDKRRRSHLNGNFRYFLPAIRLSAYSSITFTFIARQNLYKHKPNALNLKRLSYIQIKLAFRHKLGRLYDCNRSECLIRITDIVNSMKAESEMMPCLNHNDTEHANYA